MQINLIKNKIIKLLKEAGVPATELVLPPKPEMGDFALSCFVLAKEMKKNPTEVATEIKNKLLAFNSTPGKDKKTHTETGLIEKIETVGPYVNFYLNAKTLAADVLADIKKIGVTYGQNNFGAKKKVLVEFSQMNTHKAFHIGHLRGTITGESVSRILENVGYDVVRVNYQGDVGMHIAKCLYGILKIKNEEFRMQNSKTIQEKVKFLGEAYAAGAQAFEENPTAKDQIVAINEKIYFQNDAEINKIYTETRKWSLKYFDGIYKRLNTKFDRFYFESEMFRSAIETVKEFLRRELLVQSKGAVIFEGSKCGLHDRVFLNSLGLPTYEAKDLALAQKHFSEYDPDEIIHIVGKEQVEYFRVLFKVLEDVIPKSKGKERHLPYGWISLKDGKMSSRAGNVVLGEWLIDETTNKISDMMTDGKVSDKEKVAKVVALGAIKYSLLKTSVKNDIVFDFDESISLSGDSGVYLLYTVARIKSIIAKACLSIGMTGEVKPKKKIDLSDLKEVFVEEKEVFLKLAEFPEVTLDAATQTDPSKIAKYLLDLSQTFNNFYHAHQILKAEPKEQEFRLMLISAVEEIMTKGLNLLGIETVEKM